MKVKKDIKVFDPRYGKGLVIEIRHHDKYPILVCFEAGDYSYTESGRYDMYQENTLAFNDYTGNEPADFVTLERIKEMLEPQHPVEGKLYKYRRNEWVKGAYGVGICINHKEKRFSVEDQSRGVEAHHFEPIEGEDYTS